MFGGHQGIYLLYLPIEYIVFFLQIKDLHNMGYIHRDIKPANFVLGQPGTPHQNIVYMVDFGIARKIVDESGSIHTPRPHVRFIHFIKQVYFHLFLAEISWHRSVCAIGKPSA